MIKNTQLEKPEDSDPESQMGRPQKPIDWNLFEQLCAIQCTQYEIASMLKINVDTLHDRSLEYYKCTTYSDVYKKFSESGKCSLRRNQFVLSKTNAAMAIWLGKQWLGQKEPEKLSDLIDANTRSITIKVDREGLGSGIKISTEGIPEKTNPQSEPGNKESGLGST